MKIAIAVLSAAVFALLAGFRIAEPGLYYDEAHQVPAALAWAGATDSCNFCRAPVAGLPLLTMPYSGALKSALFAGGMWIADAPFSVALWRWFAIGFVVAGWFWCVAAVGRRWGIAAQAAFALLLLTDGTVLLTTRHDWGPTALALFLRFAFIAIWVRTDGQTGASGMSSAAAFLLGLFAGIAIYEKLSSFVLLAPLALALFGQSNRHVRVAIVGLGLGLLPLVIANVATVSAGQGLVSLSDLSDGRPDSIRQFIREYLSLGQGDWARRWVLDLGVGRWTLRTEALLMALLVGLACVRAESRRFAVVFVVIGVMLFLLPRRTQGHHWILGTPFQYVALAVIAGSRWAWQRPAVVLLVALIVLRLATVAETMTAISEGRTAARFDSGPTRVAERLAGRTDALIVAATWGIGNQIRSFTRDRSPSLFEPIYDDEHVEALERGLASTPHRALYLVEVPAAAALFAPRTASIRSAIEADVRWRAAAVEPELQYEPGLHVEKFVRE